MRGDEDEAQGIAAEAERAMLPMHAKAVLWDIQFARGIKALGTGRYVAAYEHLIRMFDPNDPAQHYWKGFWAIGDLAEAAPHSERRDEARTVLAQTEAVAGPTPLPRLRIAREYGRAMLAEDDEAEALYEAALASNLMRWPPVRGSPPRRRRSTRSVRCRGQRRRGTSCAEPGSPPASACATPCTS